MLIILCHERIDNIYDMSDYDIDYQDTTLATLFHDLP